MMNKLVFQIGGDGALWYLGTIMYSVFRFVVRKFVSWMSCQISTEAFETVLLLML